MRAASLPSAVRISRALPSSLRGGEQVALRAEGDGFDRAAVLDAGDLAAVGGADQPRAAVIAAGGEQVASGLKATA